MEKPEGKQKEDQNANKSNQYKSAATRRAEQYEYQLTTQGKLKSKQNKVESYIWSKLKTEQKWDGSGKRERETEKEFLKCSPINERTQYLGNNSRSVAFHNQNTTGSNLGPSDRRNTCDGFESLHVGVTNSCCLSGNRAGSSQPKRKRKSEATKRCLSPANDE